MIELARLAIPGTTMTLVIGIDGVTGDPATLPLPFPSNGHAAAAPATGAGGLTLAQADEWQRRAAELLALYHETRGLNNPERFLRRFSARHIVDAFRDLAAAEDAAKEAGKSIDRPGGWLWTKMVREQGVKDRDSKGG